MPHVTSVLQTHQQLKQEANRLKQQLVHAKAYNLHKSLAQTIRDSREQTERLRKIIEDDPSHPRIIQTVWGFGYVFVPDGTKAD